MASSVSSKEIPEQGHRSTSYTTSSATATGSHTGPAESQPKLKAQVINRAFVDRKKLVQKLQSRYGLDSEGQNNFKVQVGLLA
jgi:hypothetical protein